MVVSGMVLAACGSPFPGTTLKQQVRSWAQSTGFATTVDTLQSDARRVAMVEAGRDPGALRTDCDVLVNDALGANQNLPSPDEQLTMLLSAAYTSAADAGHQCLRAAGGDAGALARASSDLAAAQSGYIRAQARIDALGAGQGSGQ
jgi:hypothetical protein